MENSKPNTVPYLPVDYFPISSQLKMVLITNKDTNCAELYIQAKMHSTLLQMNMATKQTAPNTISSNYTHAETKRVEARILSVILIPSYSIG